MYLITLLVICHADGGGGIITIFDFQEARGVIWAVFEPTTTWPGLIFSPFSGELEH